MSSSQWRRVREVYREACKLTTAEERRGFLDAACAGDEEVRAKVEELLQAQPATDQPPAQLPAFEQFFDRLFRNLASDPLPLRPGARLLGRYTVLEKVGAGGMGEVYRIHDDDLERHSAMKVIRPE